jgi:hypothetical protein
MISSEAGHATAHGWPQQALILGTIWGPHVTHDLEQRDHRDTSRGTRAPHLSSEKATVPTWGSRGRRFESCQPDHEAGSRSSEAVGTRFC